MILRKVHVILKILESTTDEKLDKMMDQKHSVDLDESGEVDPNANPEPFNQTDVINDYRMDTLYNKKRVPYIEKNNGTIMLTKNKDYKAAIEYYNKALFAIKLLVEDRELNVGEEYTMKVIQEVEIPVSSNLTLCYLKEGDRQNVIKYSNKLLQVDDKNVKILFRRGMAYTHNMEFEKAKADLIKANSLEPKNQEILDGLKAFKQKKYDYKYKTQKICENIFKNE